MSIKPVDYLARETALTKGQSYIVQAPAGSGKTELLVQRFLSLLSIVKNPEEILAVTFTKKAAASMRARVLAALESVSEGMPQTDYAQRTYQLAKEALIADRKNSWNLINNPNRLRVFTIDSLCAKLTKQLPILSNFGANPKIASDPLRLYKEAAKSLLNDYEEKHDWNEDLKLIIQHLDGRLDLIEKLFVQMLGNRGQWLPYLLNVELDDKGKRRLEHGLRHIIRETLANIENLFKDNFEFKDNLISLVNYSAGNLNIDIKLNSFPSNEVSDLKKWKYIADLLLTANSSLRKTVIAKQGFYSPSETNIKEDKEYYKQKKAQAKELLLELSQRGDIIESLKRVKGLPPSEYKIQQWKLIKAMARVLPILAAYLRVSFQYSKSVDFNEVASAADMALGNILEPSELALILDYQIKHILIDEFQDTSIEQFRLFEKIITTWQENDGRTMFLVGDPMQSIYRFRGAEVGLFIRTMQKGIANIKLKSIKLKVNFRSDDNIISWINSTFKEAFPRENNIFLGSVLYSPSSYLEKKNRGEVKVHSSSDLEDEAKQLASIIELENNIDSKKSIAILVRARSHLPEILKTLKEKKINFIAHDIESLANKSVIMDLLSLTKAFLSPADSIAWLSILRAPWCGLTLSQLHEIFSDNDEGFYSKLFNYQQLNIDDKAKARIGSVVSKVQYYIAHRKRKSLAAQIKGLWLSLEGDKLTKEDSLEIADEYFKLLDELQEGEELIDTSLLEEKLSLLFAGTKESENAVHVMTVHKAKGLEFDTVILPSLQAKPNVDENKLLLFAQAATSTDIDFIMAPVHATNTKEDEIYNYLKSLDKEKADYEAARLLYVAATRAKSKLHLLAKIGITEKINNDEVERVVDKPPTGSFLAYLWNNCQEEFIEKINTEKVEETNIAKSINSKKVCYRLKETLKIEHPIQDLDEYTPLNENNIITFNEDFDEKAFVWKQIGILTHKIIQESSQNKEIHSKEDSIDRFKQLLRKQAIPNDFLDFAANKVLTAVENINNSDIGKWIKKPRDISFNEYMLSRYNNKKGKIEYYILDRFFIEDNKAWIIDYKITEREVDKDLISQYVKQLQNYANLIYDIYKLPTSKALYFPLQNKFVSLD